MCYAGGSLNKALKTEILLSSHWFFFNKNLKKESQNVDENFEIFAYKKCSRKLHNQNCVRRAAVWIKHEKRTFCSAAIDSFSTFLARTMIGFTVTLNDVNFLVTITVQLFGAKFQQTFKKMTHLLKTLMLYAIKELIFTSVK